jgi:hypothetical protein
MTTGIRPPVPPLAGSWVRQRFLAWSKPWGSEPDRWNKLWHVASGDLKTRSAWHSIRVIALCGYPMALRSVHEGDVFADLVELEPGEMPESEYCRRCAVRV